LQRLSRPALFWRPPLFSRPALFWRRLFSPRALFSPRLFWRPALSRRLSSRGLSPPLSRPVFSPSLFSTSVSRPPICAQLF